MYDLKTEWFDWYVNDKPLGVKPLKHFLETDGAIYSVTVKTRDLPTDVGNIREESEAYLDKIIATCGFNKFAVLISGIDSEILVRYLAKKKLDVEMYYIKFWMKDNFETDILEQISKETGVKLNIIEWDWKLLSLSYKIKEQYFLKKVESTLKTYFLMIGRSVHSEKALILS